MIKKLLSVSAAALALAACSSNFEEDFAIDNGPDGKSIELKESSNNAFSRIDRELIPNTENEYRLSANSSSNKVISGTFYVPFYTEQISIKIFYNGRIVNSTDFNSFNIMKPCPESGVEPFEVRGNYHINGYYNARQTYTVRLLVNGSVVATKDVKAGDPDYTPSPGPGPKPDPFKPIYEPIPQPEDPTIPDL